MSNSSANGDSGKASGQKMTFSQTCNLLSQYFKEKRSLSVSTLPTRGAATMDGFNNNNNNRATMNLFPVNGQSAVEDSSGNIGRTINLFPQSSGFNPASFSANPSGSKQVSTEPWSAQMTIFYGGQVLVFNDLPCDKAKEVMDLASTLESSLKKRKLDQTQNPNSKTNPSQGLSLGVIPATVPRSAPVTNASDLPIARKASLHRFLEKRRDRLVGKAPVNVDVSGGAPAKGVEGKTWLGLGAMPVFQPQQHH